MAAATGEGIDVPATRNLVLPSIDAALVLLRLARQIMAKATSLLVILDGTSICITTLMAWALQ